MQKIITNLWILFALYMLVFAAMMGDLWSGVRKAKKAGVARTSYGFRRTVDKIAKYYNMLLVLTVVDVMQGMAIWYLDTYYNYNAPLFPFVTLIGAIGLVLIEIKSIYENADKDTQTQISNTSSLAGKIIVDKGNMSEIVKDVVDYMNSKDNESKSDTNKQN